MKIKAMLHDIQ